MTDKLFPIQGGATVPWPLAEEAYEVYAKAWGRSQTLERLAERGGFGGLEFACLLAGKPHAYPQEYEGIVAHLIRRMTPDGK